MVSSFVFFIASNNLANTLEPAYSKTIRVHIPMKTQSRITNQNSISV